MNKLKIAFAGTPEFAAIHLKSLLEIKDFEITCVYTKEDTKSGRGNKLNQSNVKLLALKNNLKVFQPKNFKTDADFLELKNQDFDVMVVVAYGIILPKRVLDLPRYGCINVHGSLLPKLRGAAPIQRSLLNGDLKTGVTIMHMDEGLDTGNMIYKVECDITSLDTSGSLYTKLSEISPKALIKVLMDMKNGLEVVSEKQDNAESTYAPKLSKEEARLDFAKSARVLDLEVRGFNPWPISYFEISSDVVVKVYKASPIEDKVFLKASLGEIVNFSKLGLDIKTQDGVFRIESVKFPGKKALNAQDFYNSKKDLFRVGLNIKDL
ncbi:MAG: methionyl-tRNA formyltransferase [Psittacicella sp.]